MSPHDSSIGPYRRVQGLPAHLADWELPPDWHWGIEGVWIGAYRHAMEVVDSLGRSLSLITAPDPEHERWLFAEARALGALQHRTIPTTYHFWSRRRGGPRGPGYLRHWIAGEPLYMRLRRDGPADVTQSVRLLREIGSCVSYLHDRGRVHGALSPYGVWLTATGEWWVLGWQWAMPRHEIPAGLAPDPRFLAQAPEWRGRWEPTTASDQWQLAALCVTALLGEPVLVGELPPVQLAVPTCPAALARVLDRALAPDPAERYPTVGAMLRDLERGLGGLLLISGGVQAMSPDNPEAVLRRVTATDYELLSRLGSGTFGDVWRVRDLALGREVALKILHPRIAAHDGALARFRREAQLAAQLAHPSIVPVYDWDSRGGVAWYVMELADGGSLADLVERSGPRPLVDVAPHVTALLDGLVAAHAHGIVHRDLKPENILIDRWRRWRIADFGVASAQGEERSSTTGTPAFAAPEQLLGEPQTAAVDCFAMAGIVYFALTGRTPFGTGEPAHILARQLQERIDLTGLPASVAQWVARGLAADPAKRWPDAAAMQAAWARATAAALPHEGSPAAGRPALAGPSRSASWWIRWVPSIRHARRSEHSEHSPAC